MARVQARRGATLILAARSRAALEEVAMECRALGARALAVPADVTDAQAVRAVAQAALPNFHRIDVWINNVGVGGERGCGTLINMISIGGWLSAPYAAAYTASKFALRGFGQSLRAELSDMPRIHVCDVYPGFVDTPGMRHGANFTRRSVRPLPPLLAPERVAERIVELVRRPKPIVTIGSAAWIGRCTQSVAPELRNTIARRFFDFLLSRSTPSPPTEGNQR